MRTLSFLALLLIHQTAYTSEQELIIDADTLRAMDIPLVVPQVFILDGELNLVYSKVGLSRDIVRRFAKTGAEITNVENFENFEKIWPLLSDKFGTTPADYTVIFYNDADDDFCPPCVKQEKILDAVISSLPELTINKVTLSKEVYGGRKLVIK